MTVLERIKELEAKATKGPWRAGHLSDPTHPCQCRYILTDHIMGSVADIRVNDGSSSCEDPPLDEARANIALIAAMRNALPHLIAVAEAAKEVAYVRRCPCCKSNRVHDQYCTLSKDVPRLYDEITEEWERVVPLIDALAALTKETPDAG